jgi:hypothetical protein
MRSLLEGSDPSAPRRRIRKQGPLGGDPEPESRRDSNHRDPLLRGVTLGPPSARSQAEALRDGHFTCRSSFVCVPFTFDLYLEARVALSREAPRHKGTTRRADAACEDD